MTSALEIVPVINDHEHCVERSQCWQSNKPCPALVLPEGARRVTDSDGRPKCEPTTCGHCGRTWDDAVITSLTPPPSGRCPFEYEHEYSSDTLHSLYMGESTAPRDDAWDSGLTTEVLIDRVTESLRQEGHGDELVIIVRTYGRE